MKIRHPLVVVSTLFLATLVGPAHRAVAQATPPPDPAEQARRLLAAHGDDLFAPGEEGTPDPAILESIKRDIATMKYGDDPRGRDAAGSVFGSNPVTSSGNPLVGSSARKEWLARAIENVGYDTVSMHLKQQAEALREGRITRSQWYEHVAKCTMICNPVVQGLLYEHVRQVAAKPHLLITFATNSAEPSADERSHMNGFVRNLPGGMRFLLIGRASRTGKLEYNRHLSALRVNAVRAELVNLGVPAEKIQLFWLGYEPPQITTPIAKAYGLDPSLDDLARNRSVMVVAFTEPERGTSVAEKPGGEAAPEATVTAG